MSVPPAKDIAFIDLEASGLSPRSWPIEVGWCQINAAPQAILIRPCEGWSLDDWSPQAEALHGVSHDALLAGGAAAEEVCDRLNIALGGKKVFSDAPDWDGFWLYRLFAAARIRQQFTLSELGLLFQSTPPEKMDAYRQEAEQKAPRKHRAIPDVLHMRTLYELAFPQ